MVLTNIWFIRDVNLSNYLHGASVFITLRPGNTSTGDATVIFGFVQNRVPWEKEYKETLCYSMTQDDVLFEQGVPDTYKNDFIFPLLMIQSINQSLVKGKVKLLAKFPNIKMQAIKQALLLMVDAFTFNTVIHRNPPSSDDATILPKRHPCLVLFCAHPTVDTFMGLLLMCTSQNAKYDDKVIVRNNSVVAAVRCHRFFPQILPVNESIVEERDRSISSGLQDEDVQLLKPWILNFLGLQ